jgi:hypothetical protein
LFILTNDNVLSFNIFIEKSDWRLGVSVPKRRQREAIAPTADQLKGDRHKLH